MVAHAFDDERGAAVAHAEAFARAAGHEHLTGRGAEAQHVAGDHILVRVIGHVGRRADHDAAARQALARVVVDLAHHTDRLAARDERADRLSAGTGEGHVDGVVGKSLATIAARDLVTEHRAERTVHVADVHRDRHALAMLEGRLCLGDELVVERLVEFMVLFDRLVQDRAGHRAGLHEHVRQIDAFGLPAAHRLVLVEALHMAHGLLERTEAQLGEDLTHLFGDEHHEVDHMLRLAGEACAQFRVLCGDALRAGVLLACAHHHTALDHERRGGESELLGAEQRGDHHVAARLELAVALHGHARTQAVEHERLLGFGQADLPRRARVSDRVERCRAGAAVVAGDQHHVGMAFRYACGDRADTKLGDELDMDARLRVGHLRVVDQLLEVFDRIDVMVRRRGDQFDARRGVAHLGDPRRHLRAGQMAALTGLGTLGELDLQIRGVHQIVARHTEASRGDLLDLAAQQRIVEPFGRFAALTGVRTRSDRVHRDRKRLVRLLRNGAVAHRTGFKTGHNGIHTLYLFDRYTLLRIIEIQHTTDIIAIFQIIYCLFILLEHCIIAALCRLLKQMDRQWIIQMFVRTTTHRMSTHRIQRQIIFQSERIVSLGVQEIYLLFDVL